MNTLVICAAGLFAASFVVAAHASPPTVNPEQMDLDPDIRAKMMKEQARRNPGAQQAGNGGGGGSSNCGEVNIGNSGSADKKSGSGIKEMFGKQTTVVIQGPVINTANCK